MKRLGALFALAAVLPTLGAPAAVAAQSPLTLEVRGGIAVPIQEAGTLPDSDDTFEGRHAFGVRFDLERGRGFSLLFGFSQYRVTCRGESCGEEEQWVATQWELGTRWRADSGRVRPWLSGTIILPRVERDIAATTEISRTGFGIEGGGGVLVQLTERWWLSPGVRVSRSQPDFPVTGPVALRFAVVDLGLLVAF